MRYKLSEDISLAGKLPAGATVSVKIIDLATDSIVALTSNSATESLNIPGLYLWNTSNISSAVSGYKSCYYEFTDGANVVSGKFVYGGYMEDSDTKLDTIISNTDNIANKVWSYII